MAGTDSGYAKGSPDQGEARAPPTDSINLRETRVLRNFVRFTQDNKTMGWAQLSVERRNGAKTAVLGKADNAHSPTSQ